MKKWQNLCYIFKKKQTKKLHRNQIQHLKKVIKCDNEPHQTHKILTLLWFSLAWKNPFDVCFFAPHSIGPCVELIWIFFWFGRTHVYTCEHISLSLSLLVGLSVKPLSTLELIWNLATFHPLFYQISLAPLSYQSSNAGISHPFFCRLLNIKNNKWILDVVCEFGAYGFYVLSSCCHKILLNTWGDNGRAYWFFVLCVRAHVCGGRMCDRILVKWLFELCPFSDTRRTIIMIIYLYFLFCLCFFRLLFSFSSFVCVCVFCFLARIDGAISM